MIRRACCIAAVAGLHRALNNFERTDLNRMAKNFASPTRRGGWQDHHLRESCRRLAEAGQRVLLIDLDPGNATM